MNDVENIKFLIAPVLAILRHDIARPDDPRLDKVWAERHLSNALVLLNDADPSEDQGPVWDESHDQDLLCGDPECGHAYYRHFDTYDDMYPAGCKYCMCSRFTEPKVRRDFTVFKEPTIRDLVQENLNRRD